MPRIEGRISPMAPEFIMRLIENEDDREQLQRLLGEVFHVPQGRSFLEDFPVWDPLIKANAQVFGMFSDQKLAASTGIRVALLRVPWGPLKVALIGAVATEPTFRGKGLASSLVERACDEARAAGAAVVFLWGSEHSMYERLGFKLCGAQIRVAISELLKTKSAQKKVSVQKGWAPGIFQALRARPGGLLHEAQDRAWLEAQRHVEWFWVGTPSLVRAYAALGRGIDLTDIVHEWGGDSMALQAILESIATTHSKATLLGSRDLLERQGFSMSKIDEEFLCLARLLDPERLFKAYYPETQLVACRNGKNWEIALGGSTQTLEEPDAAGIFFGPYSPPAVWSRWLPLPLWFWGLDAA